MCGFTVDLIDFDQLTDAQKKTLLRKLQRKQKNLQSQLEDVNESLKGISRAIREVERKSKRRG
jgi:septal ring factor EnvC (AmiA/AmiB activator)